MIYFQNLFLEVPIQGYLFFYYSENIFILFFTQYVHFIANLVILTWIKNKNNT